MALGVSKFVCSWQRVKKWQSRGPHCTTFVGREEGNEIRVKRGEERVLPHCFVYTRGHVCVGRQSLGHTFFNTVPGTLSSVVQVVLHSIIAIYLKI